MKKVIYFFVTLFLCTYLPTSAQESTSVSRVDYMKVKPGMHEDYLKLEEVWKKIHQANIKEGKYEYWRLMEILSPSGTNCEYNYITRIQFKDADQMANMYDGQIFPENMEEILTKEEMELGMRAEEFRDLVKTEVWSMNSGVDEEESDGVAANISVFNFFKSPAGKTADHFNAVQDMWIPVHEAMIADDKMEGWASLTLRMPAGSALPYDFATVDLFKDMKEMIKMNPEPYFTKLNLDTEKVSEKTIEDTDIVLREIRRFIAHTGK